MTLTFNELRELKDQLPNGSMKRISEVMGVSIETVRNYFGGANFRRGESMGIHIEPGPDGGVVHLDDTTIYDLAQQILHGQSAASTA